MEARIANCLETAVQQYYNASANNQRFTAAILKYCGKAELPIIEYDYEKDMVIKYPVPLHDLRTNLSKILETKAKLLPELDDETVIKILVKPVKVTLTRFLRAQYKELSDDKIRDYADKIVAPFKQFEVVFASTPEEYCTAFTATGTCMYFNKENTPTFWNANIFSKEYLHPCLWFMDCPDLGIAYVKAPGNRSYARATLRKIDGVWRYWRELYGYNEGARGHLRAVLASKGYTAPTDYKYHPIPNTYEVPGRKVIHPGTKEPLIILPLAHDDSFDKKGTITYSKSRNIFTLEASDRRLYSYDFQGLMRAEQAHIVVE